jgi:hypothetical protein
MAPAIQLAATATLVQRASRALDLRPRQATVTVTTAPNEPSASSSANGSNDLSGGAIAGIVIGSVVGILLIIWTIRSCSNLGAPPGDVGPQGGQRAWYDDVQPTRRSGGGHRHHSRRRSRSDCGSSRSPGRRRHGSREPEMVVRRSRSRSVQQPSPVYVYKERSSR